MARFTLNLNAVATRMTKGAAKVRVKIEDGVLMIKPTDRACGKALPKGEKLVALTKKNSSTAKISVSQQFAEDLSAGMVLGFREAKHGWIVVDTSIESPAAIRVCNR